MKLIKDVVPRSIYIYIISTLNLQGFCSDTCPELPPFSYSHPTLRIILIAVLLSMLEVLKDPKEYRKLVTHYLKFSWRTNAEDFYVLRKNSSTSVGFGPVNLEYQGEHVISRPPKSTPSSVDSKRCDLKAIVLLWSPSAVN